MSEFRRVSRRDPCAICRHGDYCTVTTDGAVAKCTRVAEGAFRIAVDGAGIAHYHRLKESTPQAPTRRPRTPPPPAIDAVTIARRCYAQCSDEEREMMGEDLGMSCGSLDALRMGWSHRDEAYTFPMRDAGERVIGIRLRRWDGRKWAVPGSRNGLFIPRVQRRDPLVICEGPTDTAALVSVGFFAVGRPSNTGGADLIEAYLRRIRYRGELWIMTDKDEPGSTAQRLTRHGADALAERALQWCGTVKAIRPPADKDARQWIMRGATRAVIECVARNARYWTKKHHR